MHLNAVLRQHPNGGAIQFRKSNAGHAAYEKCDSSPPLALRRKHAPQVLKRKIAVDPWRQRVQFRHPEQFEDAGRTRQRLQSRPLIKPHESRVASQPPERWQDVRIEVFAKPRRQPRPLVVFRDLRPRLLQQAAVRHPRRTRGLAVQAAQATIDVGDKRVAQRQPPRIDLHDLVDTTARRIHFRAQRAVRRALVETQPTVNAPRVQVPSRLLVGREVRVRRLRDWDGGAQGQYLPHSTFLGSSACLTARIQSNTFNSERPATGSP